MVDEEAKLSPKCVFLIIGNLPTDVFAAIVISEVINLALIVK